MLDADPHPSLETAQLLVTDLDAFVQTQHALDRFARPGRRAPLSIVFGRRALCAVAEPNIGENLYRFRVEPLTHKFTSTFPPSLTIVLNTISGLALIVGIAAFSFRNDASMRPFATSSSDTRACAGVRS